MLLKQAFIGAAGGEPHPVSTHQRLDSPLQSGEGKTIIGVGCCLPQSCARSYVNPDQSEAQIVRFVIPFCPRAFAERLSTSARFRRVGASVGLALGGTRVTPIHGCLLWAAPDRDKCPHLRCDFRGTINHVPGRSMLRPCEPYVRNLRSNDNRKGKPCQVINRSRGLEKTNEVVRSSFTVVLFKYYYLAP